MALDSGLTVCLLVGGEGNGDALVFVADIDLGVWEVGLVREGLVVGYGAFVGTGWDFEGRESSEGWRGDGQTGEESGDGVHGCGWPRDMADGVDSRCLREYIYMSLPVRKNLDRLLRHNVKAHIVAVATQRVHLHDIQCLHTTSCSQTDSLP